MGFYIFVTILLFTYIQVNNAAVTQELKCNRTLDNNEDVTVPRTRNAAWWKPFNCWYQLKTTSYQAKDIVFVIRFKRFKWGNLVNATHCAHAHLQIIDGNFTGPEPGFFCGEIERSHLFISETNSVTLRFRAENFTDQTYFSFDVREELQQRLHPRYGQHSALYPNRRGQPLVNSGNPCDRVFTECRLQTCFVQSPAFPGFYPRNLNCKYLISTRQPFIKMFTENEEFNVDGQRCENLISCPIRPISSGPCPFDRIRVYDGHTNDSQLIGEFCGAGRFPFSIVGTGSELFVEFTTSLAGPMISTGFHFNVDSWPGHAAFSGPQSGGGCHYVFTAEALESAGDSEGLFLSPGHWYPPGTVCTYKIQGKAGQIVRLYFPSFRVGRITAPIKEIEGDCLESLTLFDGPDANPENIIKTFCDTFSRPMEKHDFVSTGNTLFVQFISLTGSYSGSSLYYWAHYDFFNNSHLGDKIPDSECDERFTSLRPQGVVSSPMNSLVYKRAQGRGVNCSYFFSAEERYYGRIELTLETVNFKTQGCQDKVSVIDPAVKGRVGMNIISVNGSYSSLDVCKRSQLPMKVISRNQYLFAKLQIDANSALNYFKSSPPLFKGSYRFIHPAVCGATEFSVGSEGTVVFPNLYDESIYSGQSELSPVTCIWELQMSDVYSGQETSLSLNIELIKLSSTNCEEDRLDITLPGQSGSVLTLCGQSLIKSRKARDTSHLSADRSEFHTTVDFRNEEETDKRHPVKEQINVIEESAEAVEKRDEESNYFGTPMSTVEDERGTTKLSASQSGQEGRNDWSREANIEEFAVLLDERGNMIVPEAQKAAGGVAVKSSQNVVKPKSTKEKESGRDSKTGVRVTDSPDDRYISRDIYSEPSTIRTTTTTTTTMTTTTTPTTTTTTEATKRTTRKMFIPNPADYSRFKNSVHLTIKGSDMKEGRVLIHLQVRDPSESFLQIFWTRIYPMNPDDLPSYSPLESPKCEFLCPDTNVCIPHRLVCNGIRNCPKTNGTDDANHDEAESVCDFFKKIPLNKMILGSLGVSACAFVGFVAVAFYYRRKDRERALKK